MTIPQDLLTTDGLCPVCKGWVREGGASLAYHHPYCPAAYMQGLTHTVTDNGDGTFTHKFTSNGEEGSTGDADGLRTEV